MDMCFCKVCVFTRVLKGDLEGVKKFLETHNGAVAVRDKGYTQLMAAAQEGHLAIVKMLLEWGASVAESNEAAETALFQAAKNGHRTVCALLLAHGSNVNEQDDVNRTALHKAAINGHHETLKTLISFGAAVDIVACDTVGCRDVGREHKGSTALYDASQEGLLNCVLALIQAGASMTLSNGQGFHPIHVASWRNKAGVVRALLDHGSDKNLVRRKT